MNDVQNIVLRVILTVCPALDPTQGQGRKTPFPNQVLTLTTFYFQIGTCKTYVRYHPATKSHVAVFRARMGDENFVRGARVVRRLLPFDNHAYPIDHFQGSAVLRRRTNNKLRVWMCILRIHSEVKTLSFTSKCSVAGAHLHLLPCRLF